MMSKKIAGVVCCLLLFNTANGAKTTGRNLSRAAIRTPAHTSGGEVRSPSTSVKDQITLWERKQKATTSSDTFRPSETDRLRPAEQNQTESDGLYRVPIESTARSFDYTRSSIDSNDTLFDFDNASSISSTGEYDRPLQDFVPDAPSISEQRRRSDTEFLPETDASTQPAEFTADLGTGVFTKQTLSPTSSEIYQSPSKRLDLLESHITNIEQLKKLQETASHKEKAAIQNEINSRLEQVSEVYKKMGSKDATAKKTPASDASKQPETASSFRESLSSSKQKRFDKLEAKIDTLKATPDQVKQDNAAAAWAKKLFSTKKIDTKFIDREVQAIMRSHDLTTPAGREAAVKALGDHLVNLRTLISESSSISKKSQQELINMITTYQKATPTQIKLQEQQINDMLATIDKLSTPNGSLLKRIAAKINGCDSWSQFKAKKAFDSQMSHANLEQVVSGAIEAIGASKDPQKALEEYFATYQKPATPDQEKRMQELKDYAIEAKAKLDKIAEWETATRAKQEWEKYDADMATYKNDLNEYHNELKSADREKRLNPEVEVTIPEKPTRPTRPTEKKPSEDQIKKLETEVDSFKDFDATKFAKTSPLEKVRQLTLPMKNKWVRYAVITTAVLVTTAVFAGVCVASFGGAAPLAVVLAPIIGAMTNAALGAAIAVKTVKAADDKVGGKLTAGAKATAKKIKELLKDKTTAVIEGEKQAKITRRQAKGSLLTDAVVQKARLLTDSGKSILLQDRKGEEARLLSDLPPQEPFSFD